jgi:hypothetical protein
MTALFIVLFLAAYSCVGAWVWGYTKGAIEDKTGWDTPVPLLSALFWPFVLTGIIMKTMFVPLQAMGFALQQKQMLQKKQRIELQTKTRIELEEAEKELELFDEELEESTKKAKTARR